MSIRRNRATKKLLKKKKPMDTKRRNTLIGGGLGLGALGIGTGVVLARDKEKNTPSTVEETIESPEPSESKIITPETSVLDRIKQYANSIGLEDDAFFRLGNEDGATREAFQIDLNNFYQEVVDSGLSEEEARTYLDDVFNSIMNPV